MKLQF
jgi:hypothetical protein